MYKDRISSEKLSIMADEATRCMAPEVYEKGKALYDRDRIKWVKIFGPRIYSTVDDDKMYTVTVHIDNFSQSTCTCVKKRLCEHIAAVFIHYYGPRVMEFENSPKMNFSASKDAPPKNTNPNLKNQAVQSIPDKEGPVEFWYEYFENTYGRIRESRKRPSLSYSDFFASELYISARLYDEFMDVVNVYSQSWPSLNRDLYRFHSDLFFMDMLEKRIKDVRPAYVDHYQMEEIWDDFMRAFAAILSNKQREKNKPLFQTFFQKAIEVARERLFVVKTPLFSWLMVYRLLCVTSYNDCLEKETGYLEEFLARHEPDQQSYYYAVLGLASLRLAANREEDALSVLRQLRDKRIDDLLFYLEYFTGAREWEKLLAWVNWLAPDIKGANAVVLEDICEYCLQAVENSKFGQEFIKLIRSWLPRSLDCYAQYLLEEDLFREWVELHMSYRGYTWDNIDKDVLRLIEAKDPAVLIPLYHQWSAMLIEGKTRKSYQASVRVLKKLRALYNKSKAIKEWNTFIYSLAARYPRMRALQEELRKGKLISS